MHPFWLVGRLHPVVPFEIVGIEWSFQWDWRGVLQHEVRVCRFYWLVWKFKLL
jgi:hypothetical protein